MLDVDELRKAAERDDSHDVTDDDRASSAVAWDNACKYSDYKTMFVIMMSKNLAYGRRIEARDTTILELLAKLSAAESEQAKEMMLHAVTKFELKAAEERVGALEKELRERK